jgi:succinyl-CoA synthetase alpha subunit
MAILAGRETRVLCQGMTGRAGTFHTSRMVAYGTKVVGGVRPGKGGTNHLGLPVFDTVREAVSATGADASMIFVPPVNAAKAMIEAVEAEVPLIVCLTERVPVLDMVRVREVLDGSRSQLVGPNSQGVLVPGATKIGVMATGAERPGPIGIVSRSASLTSEIVAQTTAAGLGQSTTVGIGGDPVHGLSLVDCLKLFLEDRATSGIILIGEIGGTEEQEAAEFIAASKPDKPIVALIAGRHAPPWQRMGHAGTLTVFGRGDAQTKIAALERAGAIIAPNVNDVGKVMRDALRIGG